TIFRDRHNGVSLIVNVISQTIDRPTQEETLDPLGEVGGVKLPCPVSDQDMYMISECLKIVFNQTLNWTPDTEEAAAAMKRLGYLISIILVSIPPQLSSLSLQLITHVAEVIINIPQAAVSSLISLPCQLRATPILMTAYPNLYPKGAEGGVAMEGGMASGIGKVYVLNIDRTFKDKNLSPIVSLINALHMRLSSEPGPGKHSVSTLLTSLITISRANSIIRAFLKSEVIIISKI
ncbi:PREDICTED: uncharacterized protein LOC109584238, partial [Amphimedon queenslandica]|uniref:Uncharacterized protein n=2 Tax=Amphimedon queenslandica TaxID=400682 RepID=A0AAN0JEP3_AMPQE